MNIKNILLILSITTILQTYAMESDKKLKMYKHECSMFISKLPHVQYKPQREKFIKAINMIMRHRISLALCTQIDFQQNIDNNKQVLRFIQEDYEFDLDSACTIKNNVTDSFFDDSCYDFFNRYQIVLKPLVQEALKIQMSDQERSYLNKQRIALETEQEIHSMVLESLNI
ncbi:MAG TPA: hypothetical protein PLU71_04205 [Candidatus Dependentiae bacterium]|nr:hypothetical protein [Candidatus Dependentiae bacterium]HRQ63035.1 hypothetical protein [Candidatus Dependentiae bacterium]